MLHLDFETRSLVELRGQKSVGLWNYANHPSTSVLMLGWAVDNEPAQVWEPRKGPMPAELEDRLRDPSVELAAFNSTFERYIAKFKLGIDTAIERYQDPQASARYLSLPGDLEDVSTILGLPEDLAKDKEGKRLIDLFSKPHKKRKKKGEEAEEYFPDWTTHPEEWTKFVEYCRRDVVAEREVMRRLKLLEVFPLPPLERKIWIFDQKVNDRGIPTPENFVRKALKLAEREKQEAIEAQNKLTGLENANSNSQMLAWVKTQGFEGNSLRKGAVDAALKYNQNLTPLCRQVLEARKAASSTAYKKLAAILRQVSSDGKLRNQFIYGGSSRCLRWSGNGVQLHNFARPNKTFEVKENVEKARALILAEDYEGIKREFGSVLLVVKYNIRGVFTANQGDRFNVCDLNAIETRVGAWMSQCAPLLEVFKQGRDPYLDFATKMTGIPYEQLDRDVHSRDEAVKAKAKEFRQIAKPGVLGCLGIGTPVLTKRGWIEIEKVRLSDLVFDGFNWVRHDGVVDKGLKQAIQFNSGLKITSDHEIFLEEKQCRKAGDVFQDFQFEKQAIDLASGLLKKANIRNPHEENPNIIISANVRDAEKSNQFINKILNWVKPSLVSSVHRTSGRLKRTGFIFDSLPILRKLLIASQIDTTQYCHAVVASDTPLIGTAVEELLAPSKLFTNFWSMSSHYPILTTKILNWTEKTITEIMKKAICGLYRIPSIKETVKITAPLNTKAKNIARRNFGKNLHQSTATLETLLGVSEKDILQNKSLKTKKDAVVRTYDILNSGPRNRFMILTKSGPLLVHNCVYRLSGGQMGRDKNGDPVKQGLWGYAEAMGVNMTQEQAHEVVKVFRESYPEIKQMWFDFEEAVKDVLNGKQTKRELGPRGCIKIDKFVFTCNGNERTILRIQLPSGRRLHYLDAFVDDVKMPWQKDGEDVYKATLCYAGQDQTTKQWKGDITSHGGKLTENVDQGIARDVLATKMLDLDQIMPIVLHVHDEAVGMTEDDIFAPGLSEMIQIMNKPVEWAPDLPLGSDGFMDNFYHK